MIISLAGIHGAGKTTLLNKIKYYIESKLNKTVYLIPESARECPYPISENTTIQSQIWIWKEQLRKELNAYAHNQNDIILVDRTLMDNLVYLKYYLLRYNLTDPIFDILYNYTKYHMNTYDYISVLDLNIGFIKDDGIRIIDTNMTHEINDLFNFYLKPYQNININRFNYKEKLVEIL